MLIRNFVRIVPAFALAAIFVLLPAAAYAGDTGVSIDPNGLYGQGEGDMSIDLNGMYNEGGMSIDPDG